MAYLLKSLTPDFVDEITSVISDAIKDDFPEYKPETNSSYRTRVFTVDYFAKLLADNQNRIFGAFIDQQLAGLIVLKGEYGGVIFIDWLVVKKDFRNQGVGTFLLSEIRKWALLNHYHYAYLLTESAKNIAFYQKRGFYQVGKHSNSWFGEDEYIMGISFRPRPFKEIFK
jgi:GNAT superfamily N-acetyltransferase